VKNRPLNKCRRSFLTLLEVLIAMSLTVIVLIVLNYFYRDLSQIDFAMDKTYRQTFQLRYLENRLADIFPKTLSPKQAKKDYFFFSGNDGNAGMKPGSTNLVFLFDNGVVLDKNFANFVLARLYLDRENKLTLAIWPAPERWEANVAPPIKKEILLENVDSLSFEFFIPPEKNRKASEKLPDTKQVVAEPEPKGSWTNAWSSDYRQIPALIRVKVARKINESEEKALFTFSLPNTEQTIVYDK